jgi:hypothetical protein
VVRHLDADALRDGADVIVEGAVVSVSSRWNAAHTGLETEIQVRVDRTDKGAARSRVTVVQPGGVLDGNRHVIAGMPGFDVGEQVRLYLRARDAQTFRVYGWQQGKWSRSAGVTPPAYAPAFELNGLVWPDERIPVQYLINSAGSDDVAFDDAKAAIFAAFDTWQQVPCSRLAYSYDGETTLEMAVDDINVILWIETGWVFGEEAAGAASLWFPNGEIPTVDVALNGEGFSWAIGVPSVGPDVQDVIGVLTHELGHLSGLTHTQKAIDTMYYSWTPWQSQRSLSADDKLGLCEIYPQTGDECAGPDDCAANATCESYARGTLCTPQPDPIGAPCNYDKVECENFCLFTMVDLSSGYCSRFCDTDDECGAGFVCRDASAGGEPVRVCFVDPTYVPPDAGPGDTMCTSDDSCPGGWYCGDLDLCTRDCREDFDCNDSALACDPRGRCVDAGTDGDGGGCGCDAGAPAFGSGLAALWLALAVLVSLRRTLRRA